MINYQIFGYGLSRTPPWVTEVSCLFVLTMYGTTAVCWSIRNAPMSAAHSFAIYIPDVRASTGETPGIESSSGEACRLASCGQCGGDGCSSVGKDTECCTSDNMEDGEARSVKGSAPCYIDHGGKKRLRVV